MVVCSQHISLGYVGEGNEDKVLNFFKKNALYELKQALKAWYSCIDNYFKQKEFIKCPHEYGLYLKKKESGG